MQINEALRQLGLNDKQSLVYTSLLQLGRSTAYAVAEKSGLKRPTVYVLLEELRRTGAVQKIPYAGKQLFVAKSPDALFQEFSERTNEARKVLPQLLALAKSERKPKILYFEGLEGVRQALYYKMNALAGKEITSFAGQAETASKELLALFDEWNNDMKRLAIRIRGVVPRHQSVAKYRKTDAAFGRTVKVIPSSEYDAVISIEISDLFIRILAFRDLQAIIIENKDIATALRQIFEMVWKK